MFLLYSSSLNFTSLNFMYRFDTKKRFEYYRTKISKTKIEEKNQRK
jgi:hypothetical protein